MARPIEPTPVLEGEDAERLLASLEGGASVEISLNREALEAAAEDLAQSVLHVSADEAWRHICAGETATVIERSNTFDEWIGLVIELSENATERSIPYRQLLGLLLVNLDRTVDISDLTHDQIRVLVEIARGLRSPEPSPLLVKHLVRRASRAGLQTELPRVTVDGISDDVASGLEAAFVIALRGGE